MKTLSIGLRTLVCIGVLYFVLRNVSWRDHGTLADNETKVVITNWRAIQDDPRLQDPQSIGEIVVQLAEPPYSLALRELAKKKDGRLDFQIGLQTVLANSNLKLVFLALLTFAPVTVIQSVRFTWLMRGQGIKLGYGEGIKLTYAGTFLNFATVGMAGGDVFKAYYVSGHTERKTEAVTTVFLDRAVGMVSLILIAAVAMMLKFDDPRVRAWWPAMASLILVLVLGGSAVFSPRMRAYCRFDRLSAWVPFAEHIKRADAATLRIRRHRGLLLSALLLTLVLQGLAITSMTIAGISLGMNYHADLLPGYFVYFAMTMMVAAVPISPQGVGTVDGALQIFFLGAYGNYSQILFLGIAMRVLPFILSLPGLFVPMTRGSRFKSDKTARFRSLAATLEP